LTDVLTQINEVKPTGNQLDDLVERDQRSRGKVTTVLLTAAHQVRRADIRLPEEVEASRRIISTDRGVIRRVEILRDLRLGIYDGDSGHQPAERGSRLAGVAGSNPWTPTKRLCTLMMLLFNECEPRRRHLDSM